MLCSHQKKFIYLKTKKSAGTSVEVYFEKFCVPDGHVVGVHDVRETVTEAGIIGSRMKGRRKKRDVYYNHMPASAIRESLGAAIFDSYYKFCVIRNPYDKLVSRYWWDLQLDESRKNKAATMPFEKIRKAFSRYIEDRSGSLCDDRHIYTIGGVPVANRYIRYENLLDDIEAVCGELKIEFDPGRLGTFKSGYRVRPEHYADYYDDHSRAAVEHEFAFEIGKFGYSLK